VRGVVPVSRDGKHLGTVEFGLSFGKAFLDKFKHDYEVDLSFSTREGDSFKHVASTTAETFMPPQADLESAFAKGPVFYRGELAGKPVAVYLAAVKDYSGQPIGVMSLVADRSQYAEALANTRILMLGAALALLLLGGMVVAWLARFLRRPLDELEGTLSNVAQGIYSNHIDISREDELGVVMQELQTLQTRFGFELAESKRVAEENLRIRFGLESVTVPVTLSDDGNKLIFMNQAAISLWQGMSEEIAKRIPGFRVENMLGNKVGDYLDGEEVTAAYRSQMDQTQVLDMDLAGRKLRVTASPVHDHSGAYRGRLSQWVDRTAEVAVESEVSELVDAAAHGDFSRRLELEGKSGFYRRVSEGLNKLMAEVSLGLEDVGRVLNAIAQGQLTERVDAEYEGTFGRLADDTNTTVSRLQEVVGRIKEATEAINQAAREIAQGNSDLSSRTEEQASSLEQTASSMEEINATVKQNAENARQAKTLAAGSHEVVVRSGQIVSEVVDTMGGIADSSRKMSDIIGVIDSIAFQTNILALNAAVEAARAGEQGRGFAVVATEVRALAQRSATAAKEIKVLIADSVGKVDGGVRLVQEAGETMAQVVSSFQKVAALVTEIAAASSEQSSGVEQVTLAVGQMDEVTQQNAALVEEAAAAAESLEDQARSLARTVSVFRLSATDRPAPSEAPTRSAPSAPLRLPAKAATPARTTPTRPVPAKAARPALPASSEQDEWEEF
jgi:methyl-accepting chemotaxis protein